MGRPPKCNPCCRGVAPVQIGDIFTFGGAQTSQNVDGYTIGTDSWVIKSGLPSAGRFAFCLSAGGKGYATSTQDPDSFPGGVNHDEFTPAADSWQVKADYPGTASDIGASIDGLLYVSGHESATPALRTYDPSTDAWSSLATQPRDFYVGQSFTNGTDVFACGGQIHSGTTYSRKDTHKYDVAGDSWSTLANMPLNRERGSAFSDGTNAYVFGGAEHRATSPFTISRLQLHAYSYAGDSWSTLTALPSDQPFRELLAGTHRDGYGYAMSGTGLNHDRNDRYAMAGDSWSTLADFTSDRAGLKRSATIP